MKTFEVHFRYKDRSEETVESTVKVDASNLPGGVAKATREFVKALDRKQKFDMNKNGLEITAKSAATATETRREQSEQAAAGGRTHRQDPSSAKLPPPAHRPAPSPPHYTA